MPKIRYLRTDEGINQWYNDNPRMCWADLVMWRYMEGMQTLEDTGECKGCDYCGRVTYGDYHTLFPEVVQ